MGVYYRLSSKGHLPTSKDVKLPIQQDYSNVRHCLALFRRRTKLVLKCRTLVDLSLRLLHRLQQLETVVVHAKRLATTFD